MLTIKELDHFKHEGLNRYNVYQLNNQCYTTDCKNPAKLYAYGKNLLYWECDECLESDKKLYRNIKIIKLSIQEIFYLKC